MGNGTLGSQVTLPTSDGPHFIKLADLNNDGKLDIVVANNAAGMFTVLLNTNGGSFNSPSTYSLGSLASPRGIGTIDVNNDGMLDILVACSALNTVFVYLNTGNGTFYNQSAYITGALPIYLATADFNGDGRIDFVVTNGNDNTISVFHTSGNGAFGNQIVYTTDSGPYDIMTVMRILLSEIKIQMI